MWNRKQNANGHFRGIAEQHRIIAYCEGEYSNEASDYWEQNCQALYGNEELQWYDDMGDWPLYEMEPDWAYRPAPSTMYLDFSHSQGADNLSFNGSWKVRIDPIELVNSNILIFLTKVQNPRFPVRQASVANMVSCWVADNGWNAQPEFGGCYLDMSFADFFITKRGNCNARNTEQRCNLCPFEE